MTDYRVYRLKAGEKIGIAITYMVVTAAIAVLFYDNAAVCVVGVPGLLAMFRMVSRSKCIRMQKKLNMEFKEMLLSLAANMAAGYSMERPLCLCTRKWRDCIRVDLIFRGKSK